VDERVVGTTPLVLEEVTAGPHVVGLELEGYGPWRSSVNLVAGQQNRVRASLEP
jgi:PEGA domain